MKKKLLVCLFAIVICFTLTGCGDKENAGNNQQGGNDSSVKIKDVSASNWTSVVKENFWLELTLPEGWTVTEIYSPNGVGNVKGKFKTGGTVTAEAFAKKMFEQSQKAGEVSKASFDAAGSVKGIKTWSFKKGDTSVSVSAYYDIEGTFEFTLNK